MNLFKFCCLISKKKKTKFFKFDKDIVDLHAQQINAYKVEGKNN